MIPPTLLVLGIVTERRLPIPVPLFLIWPLLLLGWLFVGLAWPFTRGRGRAAVGGMLVALRCYHAMRGLRIQVRGKSENVYLNVF